MDGDATVRITAIECDLARPSFGERFHRVSFEIASGDMGALTVPIWVHGTFPQSEIAGIARTFLAAALREVAEATTTSAGLGDEDTVDDAEMLAVPAQRSA